MKVETPEIAWHGRDGGKNEPILSLDFHPSLPSVLVTGGADNEVKFWRVNRAAGKVGEGEAKGPDASLDFVTGFGTHTQSVNCVRWSPSGEALASAGDDGRIFVWHRNPHVVAASGAQGAAAKEEWRWDKLSEPKQVTSMMISGNCADIYDVAWSPDGQRLLAASIDNTATMWSVRQKKMVWSNKQHSHYVQGVAWDPHDQMLVTQSSDRSCRIFQPRPEGKAGKIAAVSKLGQSRLHSLLTCKQTLKKWELQGQSEGSGGAGSSPSSAAEEAPRRSQRLFMDESVPTFFRRPTFTPDGALLLLPTGTFKQGSAPSTSAPTTFAFLRDSWTAPALHLPGPNQASIAVRCSPILYKLRDPVEGDAALPSLTDLPYRAVFAIATLKSVAVYDTQHSYPIAVIEDTHYAQLTDVAWSCDGLTLAVSSRDGYCTIVRFDEGELGERYPLEQYPAVVLARTKCPVLFPPPKPKTSKSKTSSSATASADGAAQTGSKAAVAAPGAAQAAARQESGAEPTSSTQAKKPKRVQLVQVDAKDVVRSQGFCVQAASPAAPSEAQGSMAGTKTAESKEKKDKKRRIQLVQVDATLVRDTASPFRQN